MIFKFSEGQRVEVELPSDGVMLSPRSLPAVVLSCQVNGEGENVYVVDLDDNGTTSTSTVFEQQLTVAE